MRKELLEILGGSSQEGGTLQRSGDSGGRSNLSMLLASCFRSLQQSKNIIERISQDVLSSRRFEILPKFLLVIALPTLWNFDFDADKIPLTTQMMSGDSVAENKERAPLLAIFEKWAPYQRARGICALQMLGTRPGPHGRPFSS